MLAAITDLPENPTIRNPRCHFGHQPIVVMVRRLSGGASQVRTLGPISGGREQFFKQEGSELDWDQLTRVIMQD